MSKRKNEMLSRIRVLEEENDALRYVTTKHPREAIWLKLKPMSFGAYDGSIVADVGWAARMVMRDGVFSRQELIDFFLGREEGGSEG